MPIYFNGIKIKNELPIKMKTMRNVLEYKRNCLSWIKHLF